MTRNHAEKDRYNLTPRPHRSLTPDLVSSEVWKSDVFITRGDYISEKSRSATQGLVQQFVSKPGMAYLCQRKERISLTKEFVGLKEPYESHHSTMLEERHGRSAVRPEANIAIRPVRFPIKAQQRLIFLFQITLIKVDLQYAITFKYSRIRRPQCSLHLLISYAPQN